MPRGSFGDAITNFVQMYSQEKDRQFSQQWDKYKFDTTQAADEKWRRFMEEMQRGEAERQKVQAAQGTEYHIAQMQKIQDDKDKIKSIRAAWIKSTNGKYGSPEEFAAYADPAQFGKTMEERDAAIEAHKTAQQLSGMNLQLGRQEYEFNKLMNPLRISGEEARTDTSLYESNVARGNSEISDLTLPDRKAAATIGSGNEVIEAKAKEAQLTDPTYIPSLIAGNQQKIDTTAIGGLELKNAQRGDRMAEATYPSDLGTAKNKSQSAELTSGSSLEWLKDSNNLALMNDAQRASLQSQIQQLNSVKNDAARGEILLRIDKALEPFRIASGKSDSITAGHQAEGSGIDVARGKFDLAKSQLLLPGEVEVQQGNIKGQELSNKGQELSNQSATLSLAELMATLGGRIKSQQNQLKQQEQSIQGNELSLNQQKEMNPLALDSARLGLKKEQADWLKTEQQALLLVKYADLNDQAYAMGLKKDISESKTAVNNAMKRDALGLMPEMIQMINEIDPPGSMNVNPEAAKTRSIIMKQVGELYTNVMGDPEEGNVSPAAKIRLQDEFSGYKPGDKKYNVMVTDPETQKKFIQGTDNKEEYEQWKQSTEYEVVPLKTRESLDAARPDDEYNSRVYTNLPTYLLDVATGYDRRKRFQIPSAGTK